jgi:hypothetical protein
MPASDRYELLTRAPSAELERLMAASRAPDPGSLAGFEFSGYNTPWYCSALGIRKFIKGFFDAGRGLEGYNIPVRQNGLDGEWLHKPSADAPKRFGFYEARPVAAGTRDSLYPNALLLDYGASPRNLSVAPERLLRDYLVVPDPAYPDVLLGTAYLALGARVHVSFFALERLRPSSWRPS